MPALVRSVPVRLPSLPQPRQSQRTSEMGFSSLYSHAAWYSNFKLHVVLNRWRAASRAHGCGNLNGSFASRIVTAGPNPTDTFVRGDLVGRQHGMKHDVAAVASSDQEPTGNTSARAHHGRSYTDRGEQLSASRAGTELLCGDDVCSADASCDRAGGG